MIKVKLYLTVFFIVMLCTVSQATILLDRVVAVVNQEVITWSELYRAMEADASPQLKELKEEDRRKIYKESEPIFLENLINLKLQLQEAKNLGMGVTEGEINEAVDTITKKYSMTDAAFSESLQKEGYTMEEYRKRLQEQILISKVVSQQLKSKILVTEDDVSRFLDENRDFVENTEGYRLSQIFFKAPKNGQERTRVEERAAEVLAKIKEGENFKELAKKYSEDPSGPAGGDLGFIKKSHLLKEFSEAVTRIKAGEVSMPFWTERGLHIIRLDERIEVRDKKEIREEARNALSGRIFSEKYNTWIKALREKAFIEIRL